MTKSLQLLGRVALGFLLVAGFSGIGDADAAAIHAIDFSGQSDVVVWLPLSEIEPTVEPDENGLFSESGVLFIHAQGQDSPRIEWTISGDVDPVLEAELDVWNFANVDVTFTLAYDMNCAPQSAPTVTSGSIDIELIDNNSNGATLSSDGTHPIYQSLIDDVNHQALLTSLSYSLVAPAGGSNTDSASFSAPGGAVVSTLGTEVVFVLSAGDRAIIETNFTVVPEPTSFVLLGVGLACLAGLMVSRRKRTG